MKIFKLMFLTCFGFLSVLAGPNSDQYRLIKKIPVPGDGGWDYLTVDEPSRRLFISHGNQVDVLDIDTGVVKGTLPDTKGVHGIALAPDLGKGFTSNGRSNSVTVFALNTLKPIGEVSTGKNPDAIIYDPATHRVLAFNGGSNNATVIDATSGKAVGTIDLGGGPEYAVADGKGQVFVNLEDKNMVLKLNSKKMVVEQRWPLAPGEAPTSLAMDQKHGRLFIGCHNQLMVVVNADNGKVVASLPIGKGVDASVFDPSTGTVFNSNGEGTITAIREDKPDVYHVVETIKTQPGARTMAFDSKTQHLFLPTADFNPAPAPTAENPHPRRSIKPGSFTILVVGK